MRELFLYVFFQLFHIETLILISVYEIEKKYTLKKFADG